MWGELIMGKLIQNKKLVIFSSVILILLIGVIIWACASCSGEKPHDAFSEDGMNVVEDQDNVMEEKDDDAKIQIQEEEIKAPSNWGDDSPSLDVGGDTTQTPEDGEEEKQPDSKEDDEADTTSGYGKPF